ncbi:uncharacterized protein LOC130990623 [Salvia miltiorrhiza]|uniref:uncharacterized protein LOC130990623 n=1 Tax=Salvia miltiorrhiza TaxID=226208 RepID=UPI0025AC804D|nr:uncharacterized protein LOC130990623 [Salvia miltiorrhiza]
MAYPGLSVAQDRPPTPKISSNFDPSNIGKSAVPSIHARVTPTRVSSARVESHETPLVTTGTPSNPNQDTGNSTLNPVEEFQFALIGRILLREGDKPRPYGDIKKELQDLWNIQGPWNLIPMGSIRLREWVKVFDPYREVSSLCHTWVRIYYLPVECWHPKVIIGINRHIGLPIKIDNASGAGQFGHFARILLEIDLALPLQESLLVNCDEGSFYVEFVYEQLPHYCTRCKITGHSLDKCKKAEQKDSKARNVTEEKPQPEQRKEKAAAVFNSNIQNQHNWKVNDAEMIIIDKEAEETLSTGINVVEHQNAFKALEGILEDISDEEEGFEEERGIMGDTGTNVAVVEGKGTSSSDMLNRKLAEAYAARHKPRDYQIVTANSSSAQAIILHCSWNNDSFKVAIIHGANNYLDRRQLWLDLLNHISGPSVFIGDFNAVKGAHERSSDCLPYAISCRDFQDFIEATGFIEPSSVGLKFTWFGRRFMPSHIESTIDRALFSEDFADKWDVVYTQALPRNTSDHSPLVLHCEKNLRTNNSALKIWNKDVFGHVENALADSSKELLEVQQLIADYGYSEELFDKEVAAQARILLFPENTACCSKRLFHETSQEEVDITAIEASIDPLIDDFHNALLTKIPDEEEITAAVFSMDASSSPGPDGFSGKFFQSCWSLVRNDVWKAVRTFFEKSYLPHGCNSSIMVLLPKKDMVDTVGDLRPIVLSKFFYKIIPKILASRLSVVAAKFVSGNQFGFISGRTIHDCIMLGSEGVNCMRRTGGVKSTLDICAPVHRIQMRTRVPQRKSTRSNI